MALHVTGFDWNDGNVDHIARHKVEPEEAEEVFERRPWLTRARDGRYVAVGQTAAGRRLVVVFECRGGGIVRVVTARPANDSECRLYRRERLQ